MKTYDVVIAGSGVAGLNTALSLPQTLRILLLSKREPSVCNSYLAQGGIAAVYQSPQDNVQLHQNDTMIAGGFKNNPETVEILVHEAADTIDRLQACGVEFDRSPDGSLHRTLEGGHCRNRIFHYRDETGRELVRKLWAQVEELPNVTISTETMLCRTSRLDKGFALEVLRGETYETVQTKFLVLATGGIGRLYEYTTNSAIATGDGIAFAYEMGAKIQNLSLIQFHPTAFNNRQTRECFLISESVRGEGAYLRNCKGQRFMHQYDDRLELAPRDVVSHAIIMESRALQSTEFYLDITHQDPEFLRERFPMISQNLLEQGYDMTKDWIPIYPCQHYLMGGIDVNENGRSSLEGLYAVGECSHTGVHGNNRLASNSLLEALVFSRRAALEIASLASSQPEPEGAVQFHEDPQAPPIPQGIRTELRHVIQQAYFVVPDKRMASEQFPRVAALKTMLTEGSFRMNADYVEAKSLATAAYLILKEIL